MVESSGRASSGGLQHAPSTGDQAKPSARVLGFWMCLALMVGNFIGSGIFLLPAALAPYGWNALLAWVLTIAGALCLAFVFARLSRAFPRSGGPYGYVQEAFGPAPAFVVAWGYWIACVVGNAAIAVAVVSYGSLFVPQLSAVPGLGAVGAIALLWSLTAVNCASVRAAGTVQLATTILKLLPLAAVVAIAALVFGRGDAAMELPFRASDLQLGGVTAAATITLWAMLGVESASVGSDKVRDPERIVARATMIGTFTVGIIYLLVSGSVALLMPGGQLAQSNFPIADFVARFWGSSAALFVGLFAMISGAGALNGWVLLQGEMPLTMARQGVFPRWFAKTSALGIPVRAQLVSSAIGTVLIAANFSRSVAGLFLFMALVSTAATLVLYLACALAALRLQQVARLAPSRLLSALATAGAIYATWTIYGAGLEAAAWGAVLLASALPLHLLMRRAAARAVAVGQVVLPTG